MDGRHPAGIVLASMSFLAALAMIVNAATPAQAASSGSCSAQSVANHASFGIQGLASSSCAVTVDCPSSAVWCTWEAHAAGSALLAPSGMSTYLFVASDEQKTCSTSTQLNASCDPGPGYLSANPGESRAIGCGVFGNDPSGLLISSTVDCSVDLVSDH